MKKLFTLIIFVIFSFVCFAQNTVLDHNSPEKHYPDFYKNRNWGQPQYKYDEAQKQYVLVGTQEKYDITNSDFQGMITEPLVIEPGSAPEGDLPCKMEYTHDGLKLVVVYNFSDNIYIYDAITKETLAIIDVGEGPEDLVLTEDFAYTCCIWSKEIYKINLSTHEIEDVFSVSSPPARIKVNSDETIIYIGMVENAHVSGGYDYGLGHLAAYDLNTHEEVFTNHELFFDVLNLWEGSPGRRIFWYSNFFLINDDHEIAGPLKHSRKMGFFDALTGELIDSLKITPHSMTFKPGSDSLYIADVAPYNEGMNYYIINAQTHEYIDSIKENTDIEVVSWRWQDNLKLDATGTKLFCEMDGMMFDPAGFLANFEDHSLKEFPLDNLWSPGRMFSDVSYDGRYIILPEEWFAIFDFEAEDYIYDNDIGHWIASRSMAASPVSYEFAWHDYLQSIASSQYMHKEKIEFRDFTDPSNPVVSDSIICGHEPEADYMYCATFSPVHNKIITANSISNGISIIDASSYSVDTIIEIDRFRNIEMISKDLVAMGGFGCDSMYIFDLTSLSVVCKMSTPYESRLYDISFVPRNNYFITFNTSYSNTSIKKLLIDGANTQIIDSLETEFNFMANPFDHTYYPEVTPDGKYLMYLNGNLFTLLDIEKMEIVCTIPIVNNLHDIACTDDGKRVGLVHGNSATLSIIYLDGPDSYLEHQVYTYDGGYGVTFNSHDQLFYMARPYDVITIDPIFGTIEDTLDMISPDHQFDIGIDPDGLPIVTTYRHLLYNDQVYLTREMARSFMVDTVRGKCIFVTPGPDKVYCLDFETTDLIEIPSYKPSFNVEIYPNPADEKITIKSSVNMTMIRLTDINGKTLLTHTANGKQFTLNTSNLNDGIYIAEIFAANHVESRKIIIRH